MLLFLRKDCVLLRSGLDVVASTKPFSNFLLIKHNVSLLPCSYNFLFALKKKKILTSLHYSHTSSRDNVLFIFESAEHPARHQYTLVE